MHLTDVKIFTNLGGFNADTPFVQLKNFYTQKKNEKFL